MSPALTAIDPASLTEETFAPIIEAVRLTTAELGDTPLIGFAGAPFTLAAYLVEGGPSKDHIRARTMMHADPEAWAKLMAWTADVTGAFLRTQVLAGASAAQLFDSWAGSLSLQRLRGPRRAGVDARALARARPDLPGAGGRLRPGDRRRRRSDGEDRVLPEPETRNVPIVHFGVGTGELLKAMHEVGADVVGVDYRIPLDEASRRLGHVVPLQGNVDPAMLDAPWPVLEAHVRDVLARGVDAPAHVLNLGHGVPPETDPDGADPARRVRARTVTRSDDEQCRTTRSASDARGRSRRRAAPGRRAPPTRIVVIGGGMAGLVAARDCARPGFAVTLLEACDRCRRLRRAPRDRRAHRRRRRRELRHPRRTRARR